LAALSVKRSVPVENENPVGLNVTLMTQLEPGFSCEVQVVLEILNFEPLIVHDKLISAPVPVLVTVSAMVLEVFRLTIPKLMLVGFKLTLGELTVCDTAADVLALKLLSPA
jgi:hypothetical protein